MAITPEQCVKNKYPGMKELRYIFMTAKEMTYLKPIFKRLLERFRLGDPVELEWISVDERLPEFAENRVFLPCLVYRKENPYPTTRFYLGNGKWESSATITHWKPIDRPNEYRAVKK